MNNAKLLEMRRRTVVKSLIWRLIGVIWTWLGAYFIILLVPPTLKNAPMIATLIVVYHHTTRMIMYYLYERIWVSVDWGIVDESDGSIRRMTLQDKVIWVSGTLVSIALILFLVIYVGPMIRK